MTNNWLNIIQDYLLPPTCILCSDSGQGSMDICQHCINSLPRNTLCCYRCGLPFEHSTQQTLLCGACQQTPVSFDKTHAPFIHQGPIRYLIAGLKFRAQFKNARLLGMLMAKHLDTFAERPEYLIPVPLHKSRYRQRGFNQAIEIGQIISRELAIPLNLNNCIRQRDTPHQISLSASQRRQNMKNAFAVKNPLQAGHVAIIDDVMTTGTTVSEFATLLKQGGVDRVDIWVCARA